MDRLETMRSFVAVATLGSFAGAARQLRLSPSVVTRQVAALEDRLGLQLLVRTTRSLHLTEPGIAYLDSCRQVLADLDDAERRVRGERGEPSGSLVVAAPLLFGRLHVLPIVTGLLAEQPALSIRLTLADRMVNLVEEGIDVAIRLGALADSSLVAARLGAVSRVVVASPAYLVRRGTPDTPAALAGHDLIGLATSGEWRFGEGDLAIRIAPRLEVDSADAAVAAAEAGSGITRTFSYQVKAAIEAGRLVPLLRSFAPSPVPVTIVHPARRIASANIAAFFQAARRYFRANPVRPLEEWDLGEARSANRMCRDGFSDQVGST